MAIYYTSLSAAILLGVGGQILLKLAADGSATVVGQFLTPLTVSIAFPSVSASYAIVAVLAHLLWNEPLGWPQSGGHSIERRVADSSALKPDSTEKTPDPGDNPIHRLV